MKTRIKSIKECKYEAVYRYGDIVKGNRIDEYFTDNSLLEISEDRKLSSESVYLRIDSFTKAHLRSVSVKDEKGNMLRIFRANYSPDNEPIAGDLSLYTYNKDEQLIEIHNYHVDESVGATELSNVLGSSESEIPTEFMQLFTTLIDRTSFKYDLLGNMIEENSFDANGNVISKKTLSYESEKIVEHKKVNSRDEIINKQKTKYNKQGQITERKFYITNLILDRVIQYEFDENGNNVLIQEFDTEGELNYKMTLVFDGKGNEIEGYEYNDEGSLENKAVYVYNEKNQLIERAEYDSEGEPLLKSYLSYDERGNETQSAVTYFVGELESYLTKYEYDINDFCIREENYEDDIPKTIIERKIEYYT